MNPKRQFRQLRDDDRWVGVPPTTAFEDASRARRTVEGRPRQRTAVASTVAAFVIAGAVAVGLWAGLSGIRQSRPATPTPTITPSTTPTPSTSTTSNPSVTFGTDHRYTTTVSPTSCASGQLKIAGSAAGGAAAGTWHLPVLLRNTGNDCLLASATSHVILDGRSIAVLHGSAPRGAIIPANSFASLDVMAPTACTGGQSSNTATVNGTEPVTLRINSVDRTLPHPFPKTTCTTPTATVINGSAYSFPPALTAAYRHLTLAIHAPNRLPTGSVTYTVTATNATDKAVTLPSCLTGTEDLFGLDPTGRKEITVTQTITKPCGNNHQLAAGDSRSITLQTTVPTGQAWNLTWTLANGPAATAN